MVIIGDTGVLVVDFCYLPSSARAKTLRKFASGQTSLSVICSTRTGITITIKGMQPTRMLFPH